MVKFFTKHIQFILLLFAILPALILGVLIIQNWIDFPRADQWNTPGEDLVKFTEGSLKLDQLFRQHNEHRMFVYRILSIPLALLTHWDVRYEIALMFIVACGISLSIFQLIRITCSNNSIVQLLSIIPINLLIFSPIQADPSGNWLLGIQVGLFLSILFLCVCILIAYSSWNIAIKFIACIILVFISTFTFGSGLFYWFIVLPSLLLISVSSWREIFVHIKLAFVWIFCFLLTLYAYFHDYKKPFVSSDSSNIFVDPLYIARHFLSLLGAPLGFRNTVASPIVGFFLLLFFSAIVFYLVKNYRDFFFLKRTFGWLTLSFFSLLSNVLITGGRFGDGIESSVYAKYTTVSLYFIVSLIALGFLTMSHASSREVTTKYKNTLRALLVTVVVIAITLHYLSFRQGWQWMEWERVSRLSGKACLLVVNIMPDDKCLADHVYPLIDVNGWNSLKSVKEIASKLSKADILSPKLIDSVKVREINGNQDLSTSEGTFQQLFRISPGKYVASGVFEARSHPNIGGIVLAYGDKNEATIFASSPLSPFDTNWQVSFSADRVPDKPALITAWGLDTDTGKMYQLSQPISYFVK